MGEMQVDGKLGTLTVPGHLDGVYAAGNGRRAMAYLIETAIDVGLYFLALIIFVGALFGAVSSALNGSTGGLQGSLASMFVPVLIPVIFILINLFLALTRGQTIGRHFAKTRIVKFDDGKQAGTRALGKVLLTGVIGSGPLMVGSVIDGVRATDYGFYSEPVSPIFTFLFGIGGVVGLFWSLFKTQDEANRHWIDRTCGVLTIDLRQGRDCADRDSYTGFVPTSQSGLEAPSLGGSDLRDKESLPPLPPEYKASTLAPPLPPLPASNSSLPPLPPQPTSLPSAAPLPSSSSSTPPFASAAVPTPPVPPLASEHVPPLPPLPATPPLPSAPPLPADPIAAGTLPPADGFIDEVPWRKPEFSSPAPTPESSIVPPLDLHEESHLDQTVVSPRNIPVTLVFDDGTSYVLEQGAVVGRDPQCDSFHRGAIRLQVDDPSLSVSKTHMALALKAGAVLVEDLYSTNGTQVTTPEGETSDVLPGSPIIVARGALIHFGDRSVRVSE